MRRKRDKITVVFYDEYNLIETGSGLVAAVDPALIRRLTALYVTAIEAERAGYDIGPMLGEAGLDWPPGSGDYHGGEPHHPLTRMSPEEHARRMANVNSAYEFETGRPARRHVPDTQRA